MKINGKSGKRIQISVPLLPLKNIALLNSSSPSFCHFFYWSAARPQAIKFLSIICMTALCPLIPLLSNPVTMCFSTRSRVTFPLIVTLMPKASHCQPFVWGLQEAEFARNSQCDCGKNPIIMCVMKTMEAWWEATRLKVSLWSEPPWIFLVLLVVFWSSVSILPGRGKIHLKCNPMPVYFEVSLTVFCLTYSEV